MVWHYLIIIFDKYKINKIKYLNPASIAFLAIKPAAKITPGLLVLVQEVMAAMITDPLLIV